MTAKKRITVVNDYPDFLDLIVEMLTDEGYEVTAFPKHQGAFEQIKESQPDIVICDLVFGNEIHGMALLDMLYLEPKTRAIPVILCTAATDKLREITPSLAAKGIRWLEKPFSIESLLDLLELIETDAKPPVPTPKKRTADD
ncbi:MAG: response regulator [Chloroflexaceae bacterium]|jgi:CheY-like chemotaxis protein|nr:response regulator [Chloroflexaceae bacterium]